MSALKLVFVGAALSLLGISGCAGTKMLREPVPLVSAQPLAVASTQHVAVRLDAVIFRGAPGSWAKNVDWDEYLVSIHNLSAEPIQVTEFSVTDSLGTRISPGSSRSDLVRGTRETKRRYKDEGLKVKAGVHGGLLVGAGAAAMAGTSGVGAAAMAGGGAAVGAAAVVVLVPALAVSGVVRVVNNSKVNSQIESRQTLLPTVLQPDEQAMPHFFFPLSPSPQSVEIRYAHLHGQDHVALDTRVALEGLHLAKRKP